MIPGFSSIVEGKKNEIKVLLLGPYGPVDPREKNEINMCMRELINLKEYLIEKGFYETKLVSDFIDEGAVPEDSLDTHFQKKSFYYMEHWAQILLFILIEDCNNEGVLREFAHMVERVIEKCNYSAIIRSRAIELRTLIRGDINTYRIREYFFEDTTELQERAFSACFNILYSLIE